MSDPIILNQPAQTVVGELNLRRLVWLLRNRLLQDLIPLGIGAAIILGVNVLLFLLGNAGGFFNHTQGVLWNISVIAACALLSAGAFREMQAGKSSTDWLLLPATSLEKYLAAFIEHLVIIPLVAFALATGMSALIAGIEAVRWSVAGTVALPGGEMWTPFRWSHPAFWGCFLVGNLLLLTGSAVFRKLALLKTVGVLVAFAILMSLLMILGVWLIAPGQFSEGFRVGFVAGWEASVEGNLTTVPRETPVWLSTALSWLWGLLWFVVTPVAAMLFGYFRVREKEAKDAVQ